MTNVRKGKWEFGGPIGAAAIMVISGLLIYYLWVSLTYHHGALVHPASYADVWPFAQRMWGHIVAGASPTWHAASIYFGFLGFQLLLAYVMPGLWIKGLPVPSEGNV